MAAPSAEGNVAAPSAEGNVAAPSAEGNVAAPNAEGNVAAPNAENNVAAPNGECNVAWPAAKNNVAKPAAESNGAEAERLPSENHRAIAASSPRGEDVPGRTRTRPNVPRSGFLFDGVAVGAALLVALVPLPAGWIERHYSNGLYPAIDRAVRALTGPVPFTVGDLLLFVTVLALVAYWVRALRAAPPKVRLRRVLPLLARTAAILALIFLWFEVSWAFNYGRVPLEAKIPVHAQRTVPRRVDAFADHAADELNRLAPLAHREHPSDAQFERELFPRFSAVIARLGDRDVFPPPRIKPTIFQPMMAATGTNGFTDPWTHEVNVDASAFWFERPAIYAHEWGHISGFADETEANLISVLTCTTTPDPLIQYSGWILLWFNLGREVHVKHKPSPLVRADIKAILKRYNAQVNPGLEKAQRVAYDRYLKGNGVKSGVTSYRLFVRWLVGADFDSTGLPIVRPGVSADAP